MKRQILISCFAVGIIIVNAVIANDAPWYMSFIGGCLISLGATGFIEERKP